MSSWQTSVTTTEQQVFGTAKTRSRLNIALIAGLAMMAFGAALFGLGLYHGFENGTCSTTGYSAHYGPVPHCAKGIGWWMLILFCGIAFSIGGALLCRQATTLLTPVMFVAIGAPFVALALRSGNAQLLAGSSASTGRLSAGIFGGCFAVAGLVWGALAARRSGLRSGGRSVWVGLLVAALAVGLAFLIAATVSAAIGRGAPTKLQQANQVLNQDAGASDVTSGSVSQSASSAAARQTSSAIDRATKQAHQLTKLAACVSAAGANTARIQSCEAKYMP